jgi:hypothetical protein
MSTTASPTASVTRTRPGDITVVLDPHDELAAATRAYIAVGETPETVAAYAHALRVLLGER